MDFSTKHKMDYTTYLVLIFASGKFVNPILSINQTNCSIFNIKKNEIINAFSPA